MGEPEREEAVCGRLRGVSRHRRVWQEERLTEGDRYYEWLKKGKERLPHFTKHSDGRPMLLAGLWDSVLLQGALSLSMEADTD